MNLIIDGYNLLKQVFPGQKSTLDRQKNVFIQQLAYYKTKKPELNEIIVVFDAGPSSHATRTVKSGIVIIYSGTKSTADEWIIKYVEQHKNQNVLAVTMDRALRNACQKHAVDAIDVHQFYALVQNILIQDAQSTQPDTPQTACKKYKLIEIDDIPSSTIEPQALDLLMEQSSLQANYYKKEDSINSAAQPKSKAYTLSKQERRLQSKIKKL